MWGIFNENARAAGAVGAELMAELAALDPTRPIIENSGGAAVGETGMWAWGGQSRCWSPGWDAPRPLNDVHIYLANPVITAPQSVRACTSGGVVGADGRCSAGTASSGFGFVNPNSPQTPPRNGQLVARITF